MKIRNIFVSGLCGAVLLAFASSPVRADEAASIRVGSILAMGTAAPFVAQELGYYEETRMDISISEFSKTVDIYL